MMNDLYLFEK
jgi:WASH complex subunit 7